MQRYDFFLTCKHFICLVFNTMEDFDEGNEEKAEDKSYYYGFDGLNGANGLNGCSGRFFGGAGGFGLGEAVGMVGGTVARGRFLAVAVGGEACGVAGLVGLDGDCGGLTDGVVEGEGDGLYHGVVDGFIVGLLSDGSAASATHCKQGKRRYEGSR